MNTLTLYSPTLDYSAIINAAPNLQPSTKAKYKAAVDQMIQAGIDPSNHYALSIYAQSLPTSGKSFLKAALNLLFSDLQTNLEASANPDNLDEIQAHLLNIKAMMKTIEVQKSEGSKTHTWLSREQVEQITSLPDRSTARGMRDYIVLSVLLGAGLRREEMTEIRFDDIKQQPTKTGMRDVLSVLGKGNKRRTIPISAALARNLREWHRLAGDGYIARAINKAGTINGSLSAIGIHDIVRKYGALIGIPELDAHDMRRTYAMIGYMSGVPLTQISVLLGHADVKTTQRYLNLEIDLESSISDFIPLSGD